MADPGESTGVGRGGEEGCEGAGVGSPGCSTAGLPEERAEGTHIEERKTVDFGTEAQNIPLLSRSSGQSQ